MDLIEYERIVNKEAVAVVFKLLGAIRGQEEEDRGDNDKVLAELVGKWTDEFKENTRLASEWLDAEVTRIEADKRKKI